MKYFLLFLILILPTFLLAGEKGNGGYSVVCRDHNGHIISAEVLDLYEGRIIYKKLYHQELKSFNELIQEALANISDRTFSTFVKKELLLYEKNKIFIPYGNELESTEDAFPSIKKTGCKFEQLANYLPTGEILISEEIFNTLDELNKAALALHEAIYSIRRKAVGDTTSQVTRRIVSQLLAKTPDPESIQKWIYDSLYRPNNTTPCGLEGSIYERMENCSYTKVSTSQINLVTRTKDGKEVWYDSIQRLLWSDRFSDYSNFEEAIISCASIQSEMGYLYEYEWRLPLIEEFKQMASTYITTLPNMNRYGDAYWFWTSSMKGKSVYIFNGADGQIGTNPFKHLRNGSVRCVAKVGP